MMAQVVPCVEDKESKRRAEVLVAKWIFQGLEDSSALHLSVEELVYR